MSKANLLLGKGSTSRRSRGTTSTYREPQTDREPPTDRTETDTFQMMSPRPAFSNISNLYSSQQTAKTQKNFIKENRR